MLLLLLLGWFVCPSDSRAVLLLFSESVLFISLLVFVSFHQLYIMYIYIYLYLKVIWKYPICVTTIPSIVFVMGNLIIL